MLDLAVPRRAIDAGAPLKPAAGTPCTSATATPFGAVAAAVAYAAKVKRGAGVSPEGSGANGAPSNFELLYDEAVELEAERSKRDDSGTGRRRGATNAWSSISYVSSPSRRGLYPPHWS